MNWRTGLRKGRSHIIFAFALIVAGVFLIHLDDEQLDHAPGRQCAVGARLPCPVPAP